MKYPTLPQYKDDVLDMLRHLDGLPAALFLIDECLETVKQTTSRAADEIERLRHENELFRNKPTRAEEE